MDETTLIAGGVTVHDDGDIVTATNENTPAPIAAPVVEAEAPPAEPEAEAEPEPKEAAEAERDEQGRFKKPPVERRKESIQAQIDRTRYELGEETRRLERVRQERQQLEATRPSTTPPPISTHPQSTTLPDLDTFAAQYIAENTDADGKCNKNYEQMLSAYRVLERADLLREVKAEQQREAQSREYASLVNAHKERLAVVIAGTPDWDTTMAAHDAYLAARGFPNGALPQALLDAIIRSDKSAEIVKHLSMHPEMTYQVALDAKDLPATPAAVKLMRTVLEAQLGSNGSPAPSSGPGQPLRQSRSNPPPKPVGNSPVASASSDDEPSYEQVLERVTKNLHRR